MTKADVYTLLVDLYNEEPTPEEVLQSYEDLISKGIIE